ncbi:hypothetical protein DL767_004419 [Monosporascus sp. MG133]|nr:hypothetical protein DL767_004419 [Monosporascus sp. MG133]
MSPRRPVLLVTGGSGFVGGQVVRKALEEGYNVRVTARSEDSARAITSRFPQYSSQLSSVIVPDLTRAESYRNALEGVTGVVHTASPFILDPADNVRDLLDPAIKGSIAILEAIKRWGPSVTRVVATSSFAAVVDDTNGKREGYTYTEKDWNMATYEQAATSADGAYAYRASKALAEKAMFDWVKENKPSFSLTTICPPWIYGPYAHELKRTENLTPSVYLLSKLVDVEDVPSFDFGGYADSREVAAAHLLALDVPEAGNQRFIVGQEFRYQTAVDLARDSMPELRDRLPVGKPGYVEPGYSLDGSKAAEILGLTYMSLGKTVKDTLDQLLRSGHIAAKA